MAVALKENRPVRGDEAIAERPDGTRSPFIPFPTPLRDGAGQLIGAVNMLVDVSERREAETQQRVLLNELNHRVKNNLQMLNALLITARRETKSAHARAVLGDASQRVVAMAAAQQTLYNAVIRPVLARANFWNRFVRAPSNRSIMVSALSSNRPLVKLETTRRCLWPSFSTSFLPTL
jgi:PAS domain-containing protein